MDHRIVQRARTYDITYRYSFARPLQIYSFFFGGGGGGGQEYGKEITFLGPLFPVGRGRSHSREQTL